MKLMAAFKDQKGMSIAEVMVAIFLFTLLSSTIVSAFISLRHSYEISRQLNEVYTVLSACPEIDRALEYNSVSDTANCSPNNAFVRESGAGGKRVYTPKLDVTLTSDPSLVALNDPLRHIPDSKVIDVRVGFPDSKSQPMQLRMLITRNGVGQK